VFEILYRQDCQWSPTLRDGAYPVKFNEFTEAVNVGLSKNTDGMDTGFHNKQTEDYYVCFRFQL